MDVSAGLIALSWPQSSHVSPHNMFVERERAYISSLIEKSFAGLVEISGKAASAVTTFTELLQFLIDGKLYFFGTTGPNSDHMTFPATHSLSARLD